MNQLGIDYRMSLTLDAFWYSRIVCFAINNILLRHVALRLFSNKLRKNEVRPSANPFVG